MVPNLYTLLSHIPAGAAWFVVLDLKHLSSAFLCIQTLSASLLLRKNEKKKKKRQ
jgi:hypothetical protein